MAPPPRKRKATSSGGNKASGTTFATAGGGGRTTPGRSTTVKPQQQQQRTNSNNNNVEDREQQIQKNGATDGTNNTTTTTAMMNRLKDLYVDLVQETLTDSGFNNDGISGSSTGSIDETRRSKSSSSSSSFVSPWTHLVTLVWPALVNVHREQQTETTVAAGGVPTTTTGTPAIITTATTLLSFTQLCHLAAFLLSLEYMEGNVTERTLDFVLEDQEDVWTAWCHELFDATTHDGNTFDATLSHRTITILIHCWDVMWTSLVLQPSPSSSSSSSSSLWQVQRLQPLFMSHIRRIVPTILPPRYRALYLRRQGKASSLDGVEKGRDSLTGTTTSFVVTMVQTVLYHLETKLNNGRNNTTRNNQSRDHNEPLADEDAGDVSVEPLTDGTRPHQQRQQDSWRMIHRAMEVLCDILSLAAPTDIREILMAYLDSIHWTVRCRFALAACLQHQSTLSLPERQSVQLAQQLLDSVTKWMQNFPVNSTVVPTNMHPLSGDETHASDRDQSTQNWVLLTAMQRRSMYHARASIFQKMCHRHFAAQLPDIVYAGVGLLCAPPSVAAAGTVSAATTGTSYLRQALNGLSTDDFALLLHKMHLVDAQVDDDDTNDAGDKRPMSYPLRTFLLDVLEDYLVIPQDPLEELQSFPLYPTEKLMWDFMRIPPSHSGLSISPVLSLPKLQARFLSFADYLWRNFELMRLESAFDIRSDVVDVIRRIRPVLRQASRPDDDMTTDDAERTNDALTTEFTGWARMALELQGKLEIKRVGKPLLGTKYPSQVVVEFTIDLTPCGDSIRREWDTLGEFDNLFLVAIDAHQTSGNPAPLLSDFVSFKRSRQTRLDTTDRRVPDVDDPTFPERFGVTLVRGCMILQVRDESGTVLSDPSSEKLPTGTKRIFRVALDPTQYADDLKKPSGTDMYDQLNLVIRRHGKANNFRSVLETIRGLMAGMGSINRVIPVWLQQAILGHGDPSHSSFQSESMRAYSRATAGVANPDAFLDYGDTFLDEPHLRLSFRQVSDEILVDGRREISSDASEIRRSYRVRVVENDGKTKVEAKSYPFPHVANGNHVHFTENQVAAIRSGLSPGLTLVVGPPGTGKTDVVVQIIASLYHTFPTQRTIVITHSNAALNDIFQKVMARGDMEERYLVRLGSGERNLQTDSTHDFTKGGRVAFSLSRRGLLLEQVQQLSESLGISGRAERGADASPSYTCETADSFYQHHVQKLIQSYHSKVRNGESISAESNVASFFPFPGFYKESEVSHTKAIDCFNHLALLFSELAEYRPFELLKTQRQRSDYLIMKQSRVVAMTCTHAAIVRSHLIELGFEYDNVIVEEAGQMLEIESFIPLLLQRGEAESSTSSGCRLKRFCLIGDHNQLPPVVQNNMFAKFSSLDQSLFLRLIRLGVPYIQLDKQGRSRPEIASLYSWRYTRLGNLDRVLTTPDYTVANAGIAHVFQLINVENFEGKGETSPSAYFFQNAGEAEYAVALFQYMVLIGYSPGSVSILTTYNGQKELIMDIISQRCGVGTPLAGVRPRSVSTVDQYQGQQNDIVLLSLVRTESIGHLRDVRRLVVAVSRARLGLYVFCRQEIFERCHELKRTFEQFSTKPSKLQIVAGENYPTERKVSDPIPNGQLYEVDDVGHMGSIVFQMQENMVNT